MLKRSDIASVDLYELTFQLLDHEGNTIKDKNGNRIIICGTSQDTSEMEEHIPTRDIIDEVMQEFGDE